MSENTATTAPAEPTGARRRFKVEARNHLNAGEYLRATHLYYQMATWAREATTTLAEAGQDYWALQAAEDALWCADHARLAAAYGATGHPDKAKAQEYADLATEDAGQANWIAAECIDANAHTWG